MDTLNTAQNEAFEAIRAGENVFLTGAGGTGKSYLIEQIVKHIPRRVAVTALTGCAALLLDCGAKTLHSWAGVGLGREDVPLLVQKIRKNSKALKKWTGTDVLIIDEISMMTPELFEKLDEIGRRLRKMPAPFGGIQLVCVGDFYQLPPVFREGETRFVFESSNWKTAITRTIELTQIHRQKDEAFQRLLNEARAGKLSADSVAQLNARRGLDWKSQEIKPTLLFSRRTEVDAINDANLKALGGERHTYNVETLSLTLVPGGGAPVSKPLAPALEAELKAEIEYMDKNASYQSELTLAEGAQVMLICNQDPDVGLVNGSRGVITRFISSAGKKLPMVRFLNGTECVIGPHMWLLDGKKDICRAQIPLRLAYALTIHKAQGATLDCALVDIGAKTFEYGQAYVALSRVKSLESLYVWEVDAKAIKAHPKVAQFYLEAAATALAE